MSFQLTIPKASGTPLEVPIENGEILFVLGANGTGKSGLMQLLSKANTNDSRWIAAHRQSWFQTDDLSMSAHQKGTYENIIRTADLEPASRWKNVHADQRTDIAIYELIQTEHSDARAIAKAARANNSQLVEQLAKGDAPLKVINELLKTSNLPIELSVSDKEQVVASKSGSAPFSIARLSDGERNALLIAANTLTAKPGTLILIDEPERHLHRSIISPLLSQLFKKRKDCAFVISTHDVLLPLDNPETRTLLIRACTYEGDSVVAWDADVVPSNAELDEMLKADILGSRRRILFVEGTKRSLDQPLYSLVFPELSVLPKLSCHDVEHAVTGVRGVANLHWLRAFGIVDSDGRSQQEIDELKAKGVYAVPAYSVEGLYYHPEIQRRVMERHAKVTGANEQSQLTNAKNAALGAIKAHADRMSEKIAERTIRGELLQKMPGKAQIRAGLPLNLSIDIRAAVSKERARLDKALAANDLEGLVARYPVRETPALSKIAENLGFQDRDQYESAVQKLLMDDSDAVTFVRSLFGSFWTDISAL